MFKFFTEIGFAISLLANASFFIPQAIRLYRAKTTKEVSFSTFLGFNIIQAFTGLHAYIVQDWILLIGSILSFITCGSVTVLIYKYRHK